MSSLTNLGQSSKVLLHFSDGSRSARHSVLWIAELCLAQTLVFNLLWANPTLVPVWLSLETLVIYPRTSFQSLGFGQSYTDSGLPFDTCIVPLHSLLLHSNHHPLETSSILGKSLQNASWIPWPCRHYTVIDSLSWRSVGPASCGSNCKNYVGSQICSHSPNVYLALRNCLRNWSPHVDKNSVLFIFCVIFHKVPGTSSNCFAHFIYFIFQKIFKNVDHV